MPPEESGRHAPLNLSPEEFRRVGHALVDRIADFLTRLPDRRVAPAASTREIRAALGADEALPEDGLDSGALIDRAADLIFEHSLFNGHPRFWGYITSSAAPIGALGDLLAAAVNPNVGSAMLAPIATEIESQSVRWIAELIGFSASAGGILTSGGNMANFTCLVAARKAVLGWDVRAGGLRGEGSTPVALYASKEAHTWVEKAADMFGFGTSAVRWIDVDRKRRMKTDALVDAIADDRRRGCQPFLLVGTAGTVGTGAVDPIRRLAAIAREHDLWFHVDGAYGGFAAAAEDVPDDLRALGLADSIAVDPHKWLYAPLEAGCALVRDPEALGNAFRYRPAYYNFDETAVNYVDLGVQNSRGFRALKVWLGLRQAGRDGVVRMISDDIALAESLFSLLDRHPDVEARTRNLSITTFRYVPSELRPRAGDPAVEGYLNTLNRAVLSAIESGGEMFLSNAVIDGVFLLRACIVNFRTTSADVRAVPEILSAIGERLDRELRPDGLKRPT